MTGYDRYGLFNFPHPRLFGLGLKGFLGQKCTNIYDILENANVLAVN